MKIGDRIRFIRDRERNYTQAYVATQLGMSARAYSNIENNLSDPTFSRLLQIAEVLECDIGYIIISDGPKISQLDLNAAMQQIATDMDRLCQMHEDIKRLHAEIITIAKGNK